MDHGHAHPSQDSSPLNLANNDLDRQQTPYRPLSFFGVPNTSSPLRRSPQTTFETPLSLPQRRLQLRNAGFRAPRLPSHRLSTRISRWFSDKDDRNGRRQRSPARNRENSPPTVRRRTTRGSHSSSSILQEITNSTRSKYSEKNTFVPIYEDDQDESPAHSWYHDAPSTQQSPVAFSTVPDTAYEMKLREISGNAQRSPPPLISPLARQVRGRSKRSLNLRKTSFPASEHIVFLETKLEEVEKSQYSPKTGLPLKDKVKALAVENNRLQELLVELEHQFETRLRESVEHKTGVEVDLRRKVKQLEEEIGVKDCTIRDLEDRNDVFQRDLSNAQAYNAAVERLEFEKRGLEDSNRSLEKRNDVLTELLGQSPTRSHHGFELPSPIRERHRRTPRPRSMMPRIPSSPTHIGSNRPLSLHTPNSPLQHDYFSSLSPLNRGNMHPCDRGDVDPQKACDDSQSIDSGLGDSCSVHSANQPTSKRSSLHSYASASPAAWGLPLPPSPTYDSVERSSRKRKTRRFASGSTQLKPLVLPTLNATSSLPQSAPLPAAYSDADRRDFSEQSADPTISFLSHPYDTPTQPRRRSNTWAAADALETLEGTSHAHFMSFEEILAERKSSQEMPEPASSFQDLRHYSNFIPGSNQFSTTLVDEMIVEEDVTGFLSNQFADAEDQSFSSMVGQLSVTDSAIDRPYFEEQILATELLESELPRPISFQLPAFAGSGPPSEEPMEEIIVQANFADDEALPKSKFASTIPLGHELANPLTSPYLEDLAVLQDTEHSCPVKRQSGHLPAQEASSIQRSSMTFSCERQIRIQRHSTCIGLKTAEIMMPNPLKAAPSMSNDSRPKSPNSPLDLLRRKGSATVSLTSVTNRAIFGTISRYTSYVRDVRRDPTALARRVIANAWCSNWKRLGKLSWWVLGLFLGPGWRQQVGKSQGWEAYDGENIAQAEHERLNGPGPSVVPDTPELAPFRVAKPYKSPRAQQKRVDCDDARPRASKRKETQEVQLTECRRCEQRSKASWGRSLYLWGKFSVAILLAVGGAVIQGPEEMLKDCDLYSDAAAEARSGQIDSPQEASSQANNDLLFDYSFELQVSDDEDDDVLGEAITPHSFQTAKPTGLSNSAQRRAPSLPSSRSNNHYTFGAPSMDQYDLHDDNGHSRPSRSLAQMIAQTPSLETNHVYEPQSDGQVDRATIPWMQNFSANDSGSLRDIDDTNRTIRASPKKAERGHIQR